MLSASPSPSPATMQQPGIAEPIFDNTSAQFRPPNLTANPFIAVWIIGESGIPWLYRKYVPIDLAKGQFVAPLFKAMSDFVESSLEDQLEDMCFKTRKYELQLRKYGNYYIAVLLNRQQQLFCDPDELLTEINIHFSEYYAEFLKFCPNPTNMGIFKLFQPVLDQLCNQSSPVHHILPT